ncbi:multimerin-2 [Pelodytes ibericus]
MAARLCILSLGLLNLVSPSVSRHSYDGFSSVGSRLEVHGSSTYNHGLPGMEKDLQKEEPLDQEDISQTPKTTTSETRDRSSPEAERSRPRRGNWCSVVRSRVVSYVDLCKTEKYVVRSQLPCPNGTPDCQKIMYRIAQKPVYEMKRKMVTGLEWRCCPGYIGDLCEHTDPNAIQIPAEFLAKNKTETEPTLNQEVAEIIQEIQSQETVLGNIQNDIHQASGSLLDLQNILENNVTIASNESETKLELQDRLLREVFLPHVETFLKEHFNPMWTSFNKSLQNLSSMVKNLSDNMETNRKRLDVFLESTVPKKDLYELGSKFESKIEENMVKFEHMKHDIDNRFHTHQSAIHYNLTMIKAETDMKLKRSQKLQQSQALQFNLSIAELRKEQEQFQDDLQDITQNITELWESCAPREREITQGTGHRINETLANFDSQIKDLYTESEAAFENISTLEKWFKELRTEFKKNADEVRVSFIEKSLIMEENKDFLLRQLMELNYTVASIQESSDELFRNCDCQKMSQDILSLEEVQRNFSNLYKDVLYGIEDVKEKEGSSKISLQNSFEDISLVLQRNSLSLTAQQEQGRRLMNLTSQLQHQARNVSHDVEFLKKENNEINDHIKLLDSSFSSLLEDAIRHDRALEALLGDELLEGFSEETSEVLQMSILQIYQVLNETHHRLEKQQQTTDSLIDRIHFLEVQPRNQDSLDASTIFSVEQRGEIVTNDDPFKLGGVKHMEPNHEASKDDETANSDITTLKDDIKHLSGEMKRIESHFTDGRLCNNETIQNALKNINLSVGSMKLEMGSLREHFNGHIQSFRKLFGNYEAFIASDTPLDLVKVHALLDKKMKKKQRSSELKPRKNQLQSDGSEEHSVKQDFSVAFYASYTEGAEGVKIIRFNNIFLNYGKAFLEDEQFTAPYKGVYAFSISVDFAPGTALGHLMFGGREKIALHGSSQQDESLKQRFAMVELEKGDKVWFILLQGSIKTNSFGTALAGYLVFKT